MKLLNKWWKRLLISLIAAGAFSELLIILTDGKVKINSFIIGIVVYLVLSLIYGIYQKKEKE